MKRGSTATKKASEPEEEARQPMPNETPSLRNLKNTLSKTSAYKEILSQPAPGMSHHQKLLWLQARRTEGLWVQCDDCNRWRYLPNILDSHELPKKWYCQMNSDSSVAQCSVAEVPIRLHEEEDLIHSEYSVGSLVAARLPGWPWWPAMVDDCPDAEQFYWLDGFSDIPTHYNVVFFDANEVSRAWLAPNQLKPYAESKKIFQKSLEIKRFKKRLEKAISQANHAETLPLSTRLAKYSFIARYNGSISTPKVSKFEIKKHQEYFKRKFNIDIPNEFSDEESSTEKHVNKRQVKKNKKNIFESQGNDNTASHSSDIIPAKETSLTVQIDQNSELIRDHLLNGLTENDTEVRNEQNCLSPRSGDFDF